MTRIMSVLAVAVLLIGCGGQRTETPEPAAGEPPAPPEQPAVAEEPAKGGALTDTLTSENLPADLFLNIQVKDHGAMKIKFHTQDAPKNVTNVANLAIKGFYDGLTFHRITNWGVVQGGDPKGDGTGGPGYTVEAEIKHKHLKGSMAMARTGDQFNPERRSSGSQFYLCAVPLPQLDGGYTVIGDMVEGLDVLDELSKVQTGAREQPVEPVIMEQVTVTAD